MSMPAMMGDVNWRSSVHMLRRSVTRYICQ